MANTVIYIGFFTLIIASLIALTAAIKGFMMSKKINDKNVVKKAVARYTRPAFIIYLAGFVIIGIGILLSTA